VNEYLFEYKQYVGSENRRYQVVASNEEEARRLVVSSLSEENNMIPGTLRLIRKLKPSFGEES
jgi:hypothetical protein